MDENDFLWDCALLEKEPNSTFFLVPGVLDEPKHFLSQGCPSRSQLFSTVLDDKSHFNLSDVALMIPVVEIRGNGVLDTIGGEIWEASLLLCAFIFLQPHLFLHGSVMELGSGLGLPGLLVSQLQTFISAPTRREVCLTDNDPRCVENLINLVKRCERNSECHQKSGESTGVRLSIMNLDWTSYMEHQNDEFVYDKSSHYSCSDDGKSLLGSQDARGKRVSNLVDSQRFQLLMGSALCYSPYHTCLADTALHFLQGRCEELIVIQIGDRAGFGLFLTRMAALGIDYTVEEIPSDIYDSAQLIGRSQHPYVDGTQPSQSYRASDETEVMSEKRFYFPSHMVRTAIRRCRESVEADKSTYPEDDVTKDYLSDNGLQLDDRILTNLMRTDRESFKIVRAKLKHEK